MRSRLMEVQLVETLEQVEQVGPDCFDSGIVVAHSCLPPASPPDDSGVISPRNLCRPSLMPRGTHHDEIGLLLREGRFLVLQRDDGGRWRLDVSPRADALLGRRVRVQGTRSGFDLLDVRQIEPC